MRKAWMTLALALIVGCGSDSTAPRSVNGEYTLRTVGDVWLPVVVEQVPPDFVLQLTAGTLTIDTEHGTFQDTYTYLEYRAGVFSTVGVVCLGTWTKQDQYFHLVEPPGQGCGSTALAEWDGHNRMDVAWDDLGKVVYTR